MKFSHLTRMRNHAAPLLVMLFCSLLTLIAYVVEKGIARERLTLHAAADAAQYRHTLEQGVAGYVHLSRSLAGYFAASGTTSAGGFRTYMQTAHVLHDYPGLSYIGYMPRVARAGLSGFELAARRDDPGYEVQAASPDPAFVYPYQYAYPQDARVRHAKGRDFSAIPERWSAMQQARDSGESTATAKHFYITDSARIPIIVVFTPVYDASMAIATVAQRRSALRGFVFSIFNVEEMIRRVMGSGLPTLFDLEIVDASAHPRNMLYDSRKRGLVAPADHGLPVIGQPAITVASRSWELFFHPKQVYADRYRSRYAFLILLFGFAVSAALSCLVWLWMKRVRARSLQRADEVRFAAVFENHPSAVYSLDTRGRFVNANVQALKEFKRAKSDLLGQSLEQFIVTENSDRARAYFEEALGGSSVSYDSAIVDSEGGRIEVNVIMIPIRLEQRVTSVLAITQNVTERKMNEWQLKESKQMLRLVINHIPQRVFWKDTQLVYLGCNESFSRDAGLDHPDDIIGKTDFELAWRADAQAYQTDDLETIGTKQAKINFEEKQHRDDGADSWLRTSKIPLTDVGGRTVALLGLYEDITERKSMERRLTEMAHYDSLTGLVNRAFFHHHLEHAASKARRHGMLFALMYLDLDKFKSINDTYGHDVGDGLLTAFAHRIKLLVRETDVAARLGGDEFALLLENLADRAAAESVASKLLATMQTPFSLGAVSLHVGTSIGIAFSTPEVVADDVVRRADQAMYRAKRAGRNRYEVDGD